MNNIQNSVGKRTTKEQQIISDCYSCFVEKGLDNVTIRDLANAADVNINTLYYHFNSKSVLLIKCMDYGFLLLEEQLFEALNKLNQSAYDVFPGILKVGTDNAPEIRFLLQAVASPSYRSCQSENPDQDQKSDPFYTRLGEGIAEKFGCPYDLIKAHIHETLVLLSFFSLWGSNEMASMQFNWIFTDFKNAIVNYRKHNTSPEKENPQH